MLDQRIDPSQGSGWSLLSALANSVTFQSHKAVLKWMLLGMETHVNSCCGWIIVNIWSEISSFSRKNNSDGHKWSPALLEN